MKLFNSLGPNPHTVRMFAAEKGIRRMLTVFPRFQGSNLNREQSLEWAKANRPAFVGELYAAMGTRVTRHIQAKGTENIAPEVMAALGLTSEAGKSV